MLFPPPAPSQYSIMVRVIELLEPVLVLYPALVSRVDLTSLASKQQASRQVAGKQQAPKRQPSASTLEMSKNHSSIVVLQIQPTFRWMLPMGVRDNHTRHEPQTEWWHFRPIAALELAENR